MSSFAQEYITITPLNCVKECRALIQSPKQRNFLITAALFGLYCGALLYRAYKQHLNELQNSKRITELQAQELEAEDSYVFDPPPVTSKELLLPPIFETETEANVGSLHTQPRSEIEPFFTNYSMLNTST